MSSTKKTSSKSSKRTGRAKPVAAKAGMSRNPKRRYNEGGNLYCKGGKLK